MLAACRDDLLCVGARLPGERTRGDRERCPPSRHELDGGGGRDHLFGRAGSDILDYGDRSAAAGDAGPGPDIVDGGRGRDRVDYVERRRALTIDLADRRPDGERGEGDRLISIEDVVAGRGDDRVTGDRRRNDLRGTSGLDRLDGRGGADYLWTGTGGERIACGAAEDVIWGPVNSNVYLRADCERFNSVPIVDAPYPHHTQRSLSYSISCPADEEDGVFVYECSGSLRIREAAGQRRPLATATFGLGKWRERKVQLRLTPVGRRRATLGNGVWATVSFRVRTKPKLPLFASRARWTIRLSAAD